VKIIIAQAWSIHAPFQMPLQAKQADRIRAAGFPCGFMTPVVAGFDEDNNSGRIVV
jgi:hypothetical protein